MTVTSLSTDAEKRGVALPSLPEPGQVVEVRGSTWAVTDTTEQGLPRSPADEGRRATTNLQHMVTLQSLDEDRMGAELRVVWELEVGHTVLPDHGLPETISPEAFDDPSTIGALVDAVRWGAVTSADPGAFQSPFRSGVTLEPYQLEPLRRALESPRTNLLLADDVGLGKTIEAGLVVEELLLRHRARSVIIVCPPSLSDKWREEMRDKFGLDFTIVDSARLAQDRRDFGLAANPFRLHPRVIVSMDWLPGQRAQRMIRDVLADARRAHTARRYAFDVLVVDEAHHVAPAAPTAARGRGYAVDSKRTIALRDLAECCEHRLFLSATPHNGYTESFTALLEMIDPRRFTRGADIDRTALAQVAVRRLKSQISGSGERAFQERRLCTLPFTPSPDEEEHYALLDELLRASARGRGGRRLDIAALLLKKRFLSSPWAFARTMNRYLEASAGSGEWTEEDDYYAEVMGSGQSDEEEGLAEQPEFEALRAAKADDPLSAATDAQVEDLVSWARGYEHRPDSRLRALIDFLKAVCRPDGRTWTNERVVVFTEYADTLEWVVGVITAQGLAGRGGERLGVIQGTTDPEERARIRFAFTADPAAEPMRILVATDAAGEGIDLQDYCHRMVNIDIPFNPSRLEQRIGRIDRYGQAYPPEVYSFSSAQGPDASLLRGEREFVRRLGDKVATARADLGALNPLIDDEVFSRFLGTGRARTRPTSISAEAVNRTMAGSRDLNKRLTDLARSYEDRKTEMNLTPQACRRVVDQALALTHQPPLIPTGDERTDAALFDLPNLPRSWNTALAGLDTPRTPGRYRPIAFEELPGHLGKDIVHIHLGHALMRKAARTLRSALYSGAGLSRVTAVVVPGLEVTCAASMARLVLVGRGGVRLHEEVFVTGLRLRGQNLAEDKVHDLLARALEGDDLTLAGSGVRGRLAQAWMAEGSRMRERLRAATDRRARRQQSRVEAALTARRDDDVRRAREIFAAFRRNLHDSLTRLVGEGETQESMLWPDEQQRQRSRDIRRMRERLEDLDAEEEREITGIAERYRDVRPYVSEVALVFAVSPQDARVWEEQS